MKSFSIKLCKLRKSLSRVAAQKKTVIWSMGDLILGISNLNVAM